MGLYYHSMMVPGMILLVIFSIVPMFGIIVAFQKYNIAKGFLASKFVGLHNFEVILTMPNSGQVIINTLIISISKIILGMLVPIVFTLLLNECRVTWFKRTIQTIVYIPNFLSWVIVAAMFFNIFNFYGMMNGLLKLLGVADPIMFLNSNIWMRPIIIFVDIWKNFGFSAVVYIAAITSIDPNLYESAEIDGANRWKKMWYITLPGITSMIIIMATLSLGNILNANFDQIFNMYNPGVYKTVDVLDTFTYRLAFGDKGGAAMQRFDLATAVGLFKSTISFLMIVISYKLANKYADYTIF
jgi:putative aldouronate transport system permease protein